MNFKEIVELLKNESLEEELALLADEVRKANVGNIVRLRALIEFSNICRQDCLYCGLRKSNSNITRYKLTKNEIMSCISRAVKQGYKTVVLQSGEGTCDIDEMTEIIKFAKQLGVYVTLSLGQRTYDEYATYRMAGADRYLLRIETTDEYVHERLRPYTKMQNRMECIQHLKSLGYEVGTGIMIGLPGQTIESISRDVLYFKESKADMLGIGPFISNVQTPLKDFPNGDIHLTRRVISVCRILMPKINIPATTAVETLLPNGRDLFLQSGCNVIMPNFTPENVRSSYSLYPNKKALYKSRNEINNDLERIGRVVD